VTRPSFDDIAFGAAKLVAQRSTCPRLHTGAVIMTQDNRQLCTGYNGSLPGTPHCDQRTLCPHCTRGTKNIYETRPGPPQYFYDPPLKLIDQITCPVCNGDYESDQLGCLIIDGHCKRTVHAEANAIIQAARYGIPIAGCKMYALHEPCIDCTQLIISSGIVKVYIAQPYRSEETTKYIEQLGCDRNLFVWAIEHDHLS